MVQKITLILMLLAGQMSAQSQTDSVGRQAVVLHLTPIFSANHIGSQIGLQKLQKQVEIHKKNGKIKVRERFLGLDVSFYYQPELHNSLSLMANYAFRTTNSRGFYRQIRPFLGLSQTFLNEESYSVNSKNQAELNGVTGNFYITGGSNFEFGKVFKNDAVLKDFHVGLMLQSYYPNFRFFALRPSFSLGTSLKINGLEKNYRKKVVQK